MGGLPYTLQPAAILEERGWDRVSPHWLPNTLVDTSTSHVATLLGARGINYSTESACATGTHAIGEAAAAIARDQADVVLAGATESSMVPIILAGFCAMRALVDGRDDPAGASRPFDATRAGFVMAEGAGVLVLEELERARARGARIYAEIVGYGASNDAYHIATPHPESIGVIEMMRDALERAGMRPDEVDYINAHGTSTPYNDAAETQAIKAGVRRPRLPDGHLVQQVDDRPPVRRGRGGRGAGDGAHDPPRRDPADDQPPPRPTRSATSTTSRTSPARPRCASASRTRWASAATTPA